MMLEVYNGKLFPLISNYNKGRILVETNNQWSLEKKKFLVRKERERLDCPMALEA